jgi:hypothetical protein
MGTSIKLNLTQVANESKKIQFWITSSIVLLQKICEIILHIK